MPQGANSLAGKGMYRGLDLIADGRRVAGQPTIDLCRQGIRLHAKDKKTHSNGCLTMDGWRRGLGTIHHQSEIIKSREGRTKLAAARASMFEKTLRMARRGWVRFLRLDLVRRTACTAAGGGRTAHGDRSQPSRTNRRPTPNTGERASPRWRSEEHTSEL